MITHGNIGMYTYVITHMAPSFINWAIIQYE